MVSPGDVSGINIWKLFPALKQRAIEVSVILINTVGQFNAKLAASDHFLDVVQKVAST